MPPQLSDDERSESSDGGVPTTTRRTQTPQSENVRSRPQPEEEESLMVDSDANDEEEGDEEDDDQIGEDEYVVETITDHAVDEDGNLFFEVKWEGFDKKSDRTMEPEENLAESASMVLSEYLAKIGGRDALIAAWEEKKEAARKGKKRSRASTDANGTNGTKRGRKGHPAAASPSASARHAEFKPPSGSWEDAVVSIDACEGASGSVVVYLTWQGGQKSQHPLLQVYKRCPQRMLRFYESHLSFTRDTVVGNVQDDN